MKFDRMLRYCELLERNNNRIWFHDKENYAFYQQAKQDFTALVEELKFRIAEVAAPELAEKLIFAEPKKLMYRIPRDMRAHRGEPPFNPRWGAEITGDRHSIVPIGYYLHIEPGNRSLFGTGAWCWESEMYYLVRSHISLQYERFCEALDFCGYPITGDKLKRVPRPFEPDDPAGEYLKFKSWFVARTFADRELKSFDRFLDDAAECARRMEPLRVFFNEALSAYHPKKSTEDDWR